MVFLAKKNVHLDTAETYIGKTSDEWTQEGLDAIKAWAKAGFPTSPKPTGEGVDEQAGKGQGVAPEISPTGTTAPHTGPRAVTEDQLLAIRDGIAEGRLSEGKLLGDYDVTTLEELTLEAAKQILAAE